jgi:hypothetical protein
MKKNHKSFLGLKLIGLLLFFPFIQQAQDLEVGLFGGLNYYVGDINPARQFSQPEPAYGLIARYNPNTRWAFRASFTMGKLIGDDAVVKFNESRALAFETQVNDFSLIAEFNFFDYFTGSKRDYVTPYIFGGFSVFSFNPKHPDGTDLQSIGTEGQQDIDVNGERLGPAPYNKMSFSIPFGVGVKYSLGKRIGLALEWRMHKTFTDYIDDISTVYAELPPSKILPYGDPTRSFDKGMKRGDSSTNDWFSYAGITLTYKFDLIGKQRCDNFNQTNH